MSDNKLLTGFVAGALVGVAAALLLAPGSGSDTRAAIANRATDLRRRADDLRHRAEDYVGQWRGRGRDGDDELVDSEAGRPVSG